MIFPNTQDGRWSNSPWESRLYQGVERGTAVQLIYYPEIADGSKAGATTVFGRLPHRLRTGHQRMDQPAESRRQKVPRRDFRRSERQQQRRRLSDAAHGRIPLYGQKSGINSVLFSFEDHTNDENFSDVVFTMTSNPVDAVTDIPSVDVNDGKKTANVLRGICTFEDLWPSRGDYDMNDVMVRSDYEKVFNEKGVFGVVHAEDLRQLRRQRQRTRRDPYGAAADAKLEFSVRKPGAETFEAADFERDGRSCC
ncbi:MAG: LruC domain-containing protein [Alistipes finegoldii]